MRLFGVSNSASEETRNIEELISQQWENSSLKRACKEFELRLHREKKATE